MAKYEELPAFKAAYDLLQLVYTMTGNVPRDMRYTLLQDVKRTLTELMVNIYRANRHHDKTPYLETALDQLIAVRLQVRLMKDLKCISLKHYAQFSLQSELVSKQLTGWRDSMRGKENKDKRES
jgi:four helix bundle protein